MPSPVVRWPELPPAVADVIEAELPGLAGDILATIADEVPEYARPLEGAFGRGLRVGVSEALTQFVALIRDPGIDRAPGREVYVGLGRGELRQGRSLDSLQAAYRIGARVAWRRISAAGGQAGLEPDVLYRVAEAIFAYIDELSAESVEGYAAEQSAREGRRELRRGRLLHALVAAEPIERAVLEGMAAEAGWTPPPTVAALVCSAERAGRIARGLPGDVLAGNVDDVGCLLVPDPEAPGMESRLARACGDELAVIGSGVAPDGARMSFRDALAAWTAVAEGLLSTPPEARPLRSEDVLVDLVLLDGRTRLERVAARRLTALEPETPRSRQRLLETLGSHLRHQGRIAPVAAELHVHPQTVRYRVNRLRELLGDQLEDPDGRFEIEVALRAREQRRSSAARRRIGHNPSGEGFGQG